MKRIVLDDILDIVNKEIEKRKLEKYVPCYPMLRVNDNKLYIAVLVSDISNDIWNSNSNIKAEYWCLLDIDSLKIINFYKSSDIDYVDHEIDNLDINKNELSSFEKRKEKEYNDFLMNDINNSDIPLQKELFKALDGEFIMDNKKVKINDYINSNLEEVIKIKSKELVDIIVQAKYSLITVCYDNLFNDIINDYKEKGIINKDKLELCVKVMCNYYYGVAGIRELFNI